MISIEERRAKMAEYYKNLNPHVKKIFLEKSRENSKKRRQNLSKKQKELLKKYFRNYAKKNIERLKDYRKNYYQQKKEKQCLQNEKEKN